MSDAAEQPDPCDQGEVSEPHGVGGLFVITADAEVIRGDRSDEDSEEPR